MEEGGGRRERTREMAAWEDSGHEPKNGAKSLETEKGKEKGYLQESLEGNVAMLTPWF